MNLKNRLKTIESKVKGTGEFCECRETWKFETVYHENGKPATTPSLAAQNSEQIPANCSICTKPINKTVIIVDFTDQKEPAKI